MHLLIKLVVQLMKLVHLWIPSALCLLDFVRLFELYYKKTHVGLLPPSSFPVHCHFD